MTSLTGRITYKPQILYLRSGDHQNVEATASESTSGLVLVEAFSNDGHAGCDFLLDAGFTGHLKATPVSLPYNQPRSLSIQIVDQDDKPLPALGAFTMQIQTEDAKLLTTEDAASSRNAPSVLPTRVPAGSTSTVPFLLKSTDPKGGPIHLLATLSIENGSVIAQNTFSFDADPAWWLNILLAIGGASLYGTYHLLRVQERNDSLMRKILSTAAASVMTGLIAYLFADFDLLGLKLDPRALRTYAVLGFLFAFAGVDLLLSKKFPVSSEAPAGNGK